MAHPQKHVTILAHGLDFHPFVYSLARRLGLAGRVANTGKVMEIILCSDKSKIDFIHMQETAPPPLAHITTINISPCRRQEPAADFIIITSKADSQVATLIFPDIATCDDCLDDIFTAGNHRYHYPFTNCANCGPKLTIVRHISYDKKHTALPAFCPTGVPEVLVMPSGNLSGEPICTTNKDILARLGSIADFFLVHNREIVIRVNDSVIQKANNNYQATLD